MSQCRGVLPGSESDGKNKKRPGDRKPVAGAFVFCKCVIKVYTRKAKRALQLALQRSFLWCGRWDLNPHVMDTRTSNVPVCRFQHFRIGDTNVSVVSQKQC